MLGKLSFVVAHEAMNRYTACVHVLTKMLGECEMEMLSDALNQYAQTPVYHGFEAEADYAALFALAFSEAGFNTLKPEFDVTRAFMEAPGASEDAEAT